MVTDATRQALKRAQNWDSDCAYTGKERAARPLILLTARGKVRPLSKHGEVAKRLGNGLQNRYTPVRIRSSPPNEV
jgi:hypothetical protein